ncbi:MAG: flippase [Deltaproteobacteria bacterium]|nr:flippase [Deltaproteobacteria bacterium]
MEKKFSLKIFIERISHVLTHQGFRKYFTNTSWLFAEKILGMVLGLFVGIWVARYLGPKKFGIFSYVIAFTSLLTPLAKLGFDGIVSRDIARNETDIDELLSSSALFKFVGSLVLLVIVSSYMYFFKDDLIYFYLGLILSMIYVIKSFDVLEFYYRAKVKARYIALANSIGMIFAASAKIVFILMGAGLIFFALGNLSQALISVFTLCYFFKNQPNKCTFAKAKISKGVSLVKESWPMIMSGFFALVYLNIDQVMIEDMLNSYELGQYSAAVRISSIWYFIPMTIGWSIQTAVVNARKQSRKLYYERMQMLFTWMALMAYAVIIPIAYFSNDIINLLFGEAYGRAGDVLAVHIVASLFVFVGSIRGLWVTNESYFKFALLSNVGAGLINIGLNYLWIPLYGIIGAAWATIVSYFFTYVASGLFFAPARQIVVMQLKSLLIIDAINQARLLKSRI